MDDIGLFKGKHFISTQDWNNQELDKIIELADLLKEVKGKSIPHRYLQDKTIFLMFFDKSTRTRNSFEAGITQLGGHAHFIDVETSQIAHGEAPKDVGNILSRYGHAIAIRHDLIPGQGNSYIREVAQHADIPVINMQCDIDHPCQTITDLMTIREQFGHSLRGLKIAVTWAYTKSYAKPLSVPQGLCLLMPRFELNVVLAHPPEYQLLPEVLQCARDNAKNAGVNFEIANSMEEACENADIVYAKSWGNVELFKQPDEDFILNDKYNNWICDDNLMRLAKKDAIYMHCLPADRGAEVSDSVIDGPQSVVYDQAENRLHTAKAIMTLVM